MKRDPREITNITKVLVEMTAPDHGAEPEALIDTAICMSMEILDCGDVLYETLVRLKELNSELIDVYNERMSG